MAFTYGLGSVVTAERDRGGQEKGALGLAVGGDMRLHGELTVVALVADPAAKHITLKLPAGLSTRDALTQPVPPPRPGPDGKLRPVPITWRENLGLRGLTALPLSFVSAAALSRN